MKKIAVVILALALSMMFVVVAPVMAMSETRAVTAQQTSAGSVQQAFLNEGGVFFYDMVGTGTVTLDITDYGTEPDYTFTVSTVLNGTIDTKTDEGLMHYKVLWEYIIDDEVVGTFEGEMIGKSTTTRYLPNGMPNPYYSDNVFHCVLQGGGIFKGWTLKLDGLRPSQTYPPLKMFGLPLNYWGTLTTR